MKNAFLQTFQGEPGGSSFEIMYAGLQFHFALDLWLVERGIIVMHFIQLFIIDA